MYKEVIRRLRCPACQGSKLDLNELESDRVWVKDGAVVCRSCWQWYPIEDYILDLLTGTLVYQDDRERFYQRFGKKLGLRKGRGVSTTEALSNQPQKRQQQHFDWYATNHKQTYTDYANQPFWLAEDELAFKPWRGYINKGSWLLDVGCAQGRSTFKVMDLPINIIGFDISKQMIRLAIRRYRGQKYAARATFLVADATSFPFADSSVDWVLVYGVLHHLPNPKRVCREIDRALRPGGSYLGSENNASMFRRIFDVWQGLSPLWWEEAGAHPLVSKRLLARWFGKTDIIIKTRTSVFVPPHLANLMPHGLAQRILQLTDGLCQRIPWLQDNGGLLLITGSKRSK